MLRPHNSPRAWGLQRAICECNNFLNVSSDHSALGRVPRLATRTSTNFVSLRRAGASNGVCRQQKICLHSAVQECTAAQTEGKTCWCHINDDSHSCALPGLGEHSTAESASMFAVRFHCSSQAHKTATPHSQATSSGKMKRRTTSRASRAAPC